MVYERTGIWGTYYGSSYTDSGYLTEDQRKVNAIYIYSCLLAEGWSHNAICGLLGNMQQESDLNPGRWQSNDVGNLDGGYGLVQWTPASKYTFWCAENSLSPAAMDSNLARIFYEIEKGLQWIPTSDYNFSFKEFTTSTKSVDYLTKAFLYNYERAGVSALENRLNYAANWSEYILGVLGGDPPTPPDPDEPDIPTGTKKRKGFKFLLFD